MGFMPNPDGTACVLAGGDAGNFDAGGTMFDAGPDTGPPVETDAGPDIDSGPAASCDDYDVECTPDRGCIQAGFVCEAERAFTTGGGTDPITDAPAGEDPYPSSIFVDGMCTPRGIQTTGTPEACDADDDEETACGDCGSCTDLGGVTMCLRDCEPSLTDNGGCRDNFSCSLTDGVCLPVGCTTDTQCRVARRDTNGIAGIQTPDLCTASPAQCGDSANNFDALVYDTDSAAICNLDTYECTGEPSTPGASGGDTCTDDADCEDGGFCIEEGGSCTTDSEVDCINNDQCTAAITGAASDGTCDISWTGGSCIKLGCDVVGNECANDGVCQERGLGVTACLEGCTVGAGADPEDAATWTDPTTANGGCRDSYGCFWKGVGGHGVANNGVCLPSTFNDVTEPNVGSVCDTADECFGPFGQARCIRFDPLDEFGYCTVNDCTAPFFDPASTANVCGGENICGNFGSAEDPFGLCLERCDDEAGVPDANLCEGENMGCRGDVLTDVNVCFPGCSTTEQCPTGETCEGATAEESGICTAG
ncbi:MAG: hypothetical protein ACI9KE_001756 [Polyangiales bacterium]|jgi:hypothetical protein